MRRQALRVGPMSRTGAADTRDVPRRPHRRDKGARDGYGQVRGVENVWAAGDATDFAVKHGGIAAQQADAAALSIAGLAGAPLQPKPFEPVPRDFC
jgi:hypothetical protein